MNKFKLLCGLLPIVFLCGCTFVQPPATEPTTPPAPTVTTPPETEPPTEPPTEAPTEPPTESPTEAPTEPPSTNDDDYNLVFYWIAPLMSTGENLIMCADGSDVWVDLSGGNEIALPDVNLIEHDYETYPLSCDWNLCKVQCNYPGEISDTWTILRITVANYWDLGTYEPSWDPRRDGMVYDIQRYEDIKITGKDTLLIQGFGDRGAPGVRGHYQFSTTTMVCCTECPEEWLSQWDGVVEEAPSYHGGTEEPWNFHLTHSN